MSIGKIIASSTILSLTSALDIKLAEEHDIPIKLTDLDIPMEEYNLLDGFDVKGPEWFSSRRLSAWE